MDNYYKIEGNKVHQIIDGWHFTTIVPSSIPIIIREVKNDTMICGLCKWYNGDTWCCEKHLNWGEMVERDTCSDYKECDYNVNNN